MALLTALLGIGLALLAAWLGWLAAVVLCLAPFGAGALSVVAAVAIGADGPRTSSALFRLAVLLPLSIGTTAGAVGIWLATLVIQAQGSPPTAWATAVGTATAAVLTTIVGKLQGLDGLMPHAVARRMVVWRYHRHFPHLGVPHSAAFRVAYDAIHADALQRPGEPPIKGWGFAETARRLELVRAGLRSLSPPLP